MSRIKPPEPSLLARDTYTEEETYGYIADDMEAYADARVREALEEALACVGDYRHFPPITTAFDNGYERGLEKASAIIRTKLPTKK